MGIYCSLYRVEADELERLAEDAEARARLMGIDPASAPTLVEVRPPGCLGLILRVLPVTLSEPAPLPERSGSSGPDPERTLDREHTLELEKSWHGLHFLFTGSADGGEEPGCFLVSGGDPLDDEGWLRALEPTAVRSWAAYLDALSAGELERRYDPARMSALDIYPEIWERTEENPRDWLLAAYEDLRAFVSRAAEAGDAVVVCVA